MLKLKLIALISLTYTSLMGQQKLWTTEKEVGIERISIKSTPEKVLENFDRYKFYYDYTGLLKNDYLESLLDKSNTDSTNYKQQKKYFESIKGPIVFATRKSDGLGSSYVEISIITPNNINTIIFSNTPSRQTNINLIIDSENDREKFKKWFKSLLK